MTCNEFVRVLPELEGGHTIEQQQHLRACPRCAELIADLNAITQQAQLLRNADLEEPSPRVWNSIEIALRQEGLIREPLPTAVPVGFRTSRRRLVWLVPAMATLLVVVGLLVYEKGGVQPPVATAPVIAPTTDVASVAPDLVPDEQQLLNLVEARTPALRQSFESDLRAVDSYIQDAEESARNNPNDEIAQQHLMNAYEQRAMVYEMAMDHTVQ